VLLDKVASSTRNANVQKRVVLGDDLPARPGTVVVARVLGDKAIYNQLEDVHGRMMTVHRGDVLAGVLGARKALRGYSGVVPERVEPGDVLQLLNLGGVIGLCTSANPELGAPLDVEVLGSVLQFPQLGRRVGVPATIDNGSVGHLDRLGSVPPMIMVVGTCMHAGKTRAACALVREATARGLRVGVAKVTGVALRRDTLEMLDHGAVSACTFADAGMPSTCAGDVLPVARGCIASAARGADLLIVECGDGLLGEYGVKDVLSAPDISASISALVLAATDPVAACGGFQLLDALGLQTSVVTGPATDNTAGVDALVRAGIAVPAINARSHAMQLADIALGGLGFSVKQLEAVP
jgi:hypothetical protein